MNRKRICKSNSRVPSLKVTHDEETNEVSVDVCDDPYQYGTLDVSNLPVLVTVGQVINIHRKLLIRIINLFIR